MSVRSGLFIILLVISTTLQAQPEKFDLASFTPPARWKKSVTNNVLQYSTTDTKDKSFCLLSFYKSIPSQGDAGTDFNTEWQGIVAKQLPVSDPQGDTTMESNGWIIKTAASPFRFENADAIAMLTVFSGHGKCMSVLITTNNDRYLPEAYGVLDNMVLDIPAGTVTKQEEQLNTPPVNIPPPAAINDGFSFSSTNFDDGWVSTIQADWVEVRKNDIRVLIHYPNPVTDEYNSDAAAKENRVWDYLVGPRYTSLRNFERLKSFASYEPHHFMAGTLTDQTGREVFVALFNKGDKTGYWLEFICPDRASFTREFGVDKYDAYSNVWDPMFKMGNYNKFGVSLADLQGKWTTSFTGITQYVNIYTGFAAGAESYSSAQDYEFLPGNTYNWQIHVASGSTGSMKHQNVKSSGKLGMSDNWNIHLSNMEGRPQTYPVSFRCVKGARILWINGMAYGKQ
ncbi:MAG: hypothetical protein EOO09_06230 [Chitinophagaceae bacterium]|nr:MAG: hypothetical protein EOO09_06230 [Chitinophagaceae bacterium]